VRSLLEGLRLDLVAGSLFHTVGSETAPLLQIRTSKTYTFREKNIIGFRFDVDTYFRRNVADPLRFTLGGPLRLSASSIDEYRGTEDVLIRSGYLRRIAALPSGLGQGLYVTAPTKQQKYGHRNTPPFSVRTVSREL
jgi:NTE family protein